MTQLFSITSAFGAAYQIPKHIRSVVSHDLTALIELFCRI